MNKTVVDINFSVSGQIISSDIKELFEFGVKSVVCNRPDNESLDQPEMAEIEAEAAFYGIKFVALPVISGNIVSEDVIDFREAYEELPKPIHAYCRTGRRSITLWAMMKLEDGDAKNKVDLVTQSLGYKLSIFDNRSSDQLIQK